MGTPAVTMLATALLGVLGTVVATTSSPQSENTCSTSSGFSSSPSSCSSYFYCDGGGQVRKAQCGEGQLWSEDLLACDDEQNVSCGKGIFWLLRKGAAFFRVGFQLASIAHRVTSNLAGTGTNQTVDKAEEKEEQVLQERTVTDEQIQNEEIATNEENKTIKEQEEVSGYLSYTDDTEDDYYHEEKESIKNTKEDYNENDKLSIGNFVNKKVADIDTNKPEEPMFKKSRAIHLKPQTVPNHDKRVPTNTQQNTKRTNSKSKDRVETRIMTSAASKQSTLPEYNPVQTSDKQTQSEAVFSEPAGTSNLTKPAHSSLPWIVKKWVPPV